MATQTITQEFTVVGMTCGHCVQAVSDELSSLPGVEDVAVDLDTGVATVRSAAGVTDEQARVAIDEAGYELAS